MRERLAILFRFQKEGLKMSRSSIKSAVLTSFAVSFAVTATVVTYGMLSSSQDDTPASFTDVPKSYWAYNEIEKAYADGVMTGRTYDAETGARTYAPDEATSVTEFITMLTRAFYPEEYTGNSEDWYNEALSASNNHNLIPSNQWEAMTQRPITRYQIAEYTYQVMSDTLPEDTRDSWQLTQEQAEAMQEYVGDYASLDADKSMTAVNMIYLGLINGTDDANSFYGSGTITRAEAAVFYVRLLDVLNKIETGKFKSAYKEVADLPNAQEKTPAESSSFKLTNGEQPTDENITALLYSLEDKYPEGTQWGLEQEYSWGIWGGIACDAFAYTMMDEIYGDWSESLPLTYSATFCYDDIRPGDRLVMDNFNGSSHSMIVLEKYDNRIVIAEGNYGKTVHWGRVITRDKLESAFMRRYGLDDSKLAA
jgi:hypothetical protein